MRSRANSGLWGGIPLGFFEPIKSKIKRKQMKRSNLILLTALMLAWATPPSIAANIPLEKQILKLQPQADKNGDGKLSKAEEAGLHKMILKRFPQADQDGDGVLSIKEQRAVIRRAAARVKRNGRQNSDVKTLSRTLGNISDPEKTHLAKWGAKTPHMDRLASKGMLFANAHCAAPACGPSRSAIMSGIRPSTSSNFTVIIPSYDLVVVRRGLDKQPRRHGFGRWTSAAEVLKAFSHQ